MLNKMAAVSWECANIDIVLSNMFAVILLKKRAKYLLEFLKQVQRYVAMRILNVDPIYSGSDKNISELN